MKRNWLNIDTCSHTGCKRKVTHVIFLNTPHDADYVVGACSAHKVEADFEYMTITKFRRGLEKLIRSGVSESNLAVAVFNAIESRMTKTIRLIECCSCGLFHPEGLEAGGSANYRNDCRYDANRFTSAEDYTERTGKPAVEVWLEEEET